MIACEGPEGPEGPVGPEGPAGEVIELIVTVANKMYTTGNPYWVTVYYDNSDTDENTTVIYTGFKNDNGVWVNVTVYESYYCCNIYASGDYGYDGKSGYLISIPVASETVSTSQTVLQPVQYCPLKPVFPFVFIFLTYLLCELCKANYFPSTGVCKK